MWNVHHALRILCLFFYSAIEYKKNLLHIITQSQINSVFWSEKKNHSSPIILLSVSNYESFISFPWKSSLNRIKFSKKTQPKKNFSFNYQPQNYQTQQISALALIDALPLTRETPRDRTHLASFHGPQKLEGRPLVHEKSSIANCKQCPFIKLLIKDGKATKENKISIQMRTSSKLSLCSPLPPLPTWSLLVGLFVSTFSGWDVLSLFWRQGARPSLSCPLTLFCSASIEPSA